AQLRFGPRIYASAGGCYRAGTDWRPQGKAVIAGLDPAIHPSRKLFAKKMDARGASAFTRVHSPSKTGINALTDALLPAHDVSSGARANAVAHPTIVAD